MLPTLAETTRLLRCRGCVILSRLKSRPPPCYRWRRFMGTSKGFHECHYTILGVRRDATQSEIKDAFFSKSKLMHPDHYPNDPTMHDSFVRLNEAYTVLSRATTRREYDFSLAARLAHQQRMGQGRPNSDGSHMPGSGTYHGEHATEKTFWDESIFEMRDRSKDHDHLYQDDAYYGVKGVPKMSNVYIVGACFLVMALGTAMHFGTWLYSKRVAQAVFDERDRKAHFHLADARRLAKENGNEKQLELLKARKIEGRTPPPTRMPARVTRSDS